MQVSKRTERAFKERDKMLMQGDMADYSQDYHDYCSTLCEIVEEMEKIKPSADSPELSERAYRQAVDDCIAIVREIGKP